MSFGREIERIVTAKAGAVMEKLTGEQTRRIEAAVFRLGAFKQQQVLDPMHAAAYQPDVEAALLSIESIVAESGFDVERAVNEAVAEVIGKALRVGLALVVA